MAESLPSWELDFEADDLAIEQDGVRCPIQWCEAHRHRSSPCGDSSGPFVGVHVGRVRAAARQAATERRRNERLAEAIGVPVEQVLATRFMLTCCETAVESGLVAGPETRAMAEQRRARKRLGMEE